MCILQTEKEGALFFWKMVVKPYLISGVHNIHIIITYFITGQIRRTILITRMFEHTLNQLALEQATKGLDDGRVKQIK